MLPPSLGRGWTQGEPVEGRLSLGSVQAGLRPSYFVVSVTNGMQVQMCYVEATADKLSRCVWEPLFFRATRVSSQKQVKKELQCPVPSPPHLYLPHSVPQKLVVWDSSHKGLSFFVVVLSPATAVRYVSHVAL